jgi:hypothetical protein
VALAALLAFGETGGAQSAPPGWQDPGDGAWVAFTLGATTLGTVSRTDTRWGPVTVNRHTSPGLDVEGAFGNWEARQVAPGVIEAGWPASWSADGRTFERAVDWCPALSSSCSYFVVGGGGGQFFAAAGTPLDSLGQPDPGLLLQFQQSISLNDPPTMSIVFNPNLSPVKGVDGQPGHITLDASGTTDGLPGDLQYAWTVKDSANNVVASASGPIANVNLSEDGTYCIAVTVTNPSDGYSQSFDAGCALVTGVAPDRVDPGPGPGPDNGGGGGGGGTGGPGGGGPAPAPVSSPPAQGVGQEIAAEPIVFAPPRRDVPSALFGGQNGEAQVIWLWQPNWFNEARGPRAPRTTAPPIVQERDDIVVGSNEPAPDSNAAPWLAGLAAFGLLGLGWTFIRRRRVRRAEL